MMSEWENSVCVCVNEVSVMCVMMLWFGLMGVWFDCMFFRDVNVIRITRFNMLMCLGCWVCFGIIELVLCEWLLVFYF